LWGGQGWPTAGKERKAQQCSWRERLQTRLRLLLLLLLLLQLAGPSRLYL
jgi:hypothetical protein